MNSILNLIAKKASLVLCLENDVVDCFGAQKLTKEELTHEASEIASYLSLSNNQQPTSAGKKRGQAESQAGRPSTREVDLI